MSADGAHLGGLLAHHDVATVGALPDHIAVAGEDQTTLDVGDQLAIALLVLLLDLGDLLKQESDLLEALLVSVLGHLIVHIGPLVVLALGSGVQVLHGVANAAQQLEPDLGMLLLVVGGLLKDLGDLDIAVLLGLGSKIGVLVAGLRLAGKSGPQVGLGLSTLQLRIHHDKFLPILKINLPFNKNNSRLI